MGLITTMRYRGYWERYCCSSCHSRTPKSNRTTTYRRATSSPRYSPQLATPHKRQAANEFLPD